MQEAQAEVNPQWWRDSDFTIVAGENAGYEILNSPARPSAIFAVNDDLAIGVMAAAHRLGLEIGRDVSLVVITIFLWSAVCRSLNLGKNAA
ncbi:sugar binding transcriptional regulator LacI family [Klebsiella aerogenes]|nr:sugar binding transcriptional regulator LacI family [Klebsiella aerogenes]